MIRIAELHLLVHDVAIHVKNGATWAQLPSRPWIKDGQVAVGDDGRAKYMPLFEFYSAAIRNAFSDAVIRAVLEFDPCAPCRGACGVTTLATIKRTLDD